MGRRPHFPGVLPEVEAGGGLRRMVGNSLKSGTGLNAEG